MRRHLVILLLVVCNTLMAQMPLQLRLTFDDGLEEHATVVMPLLDSLGLKGTFYLIPRNIDCGKEVRSAKTCKWEQARLLMAHGHIIGNHTYSHRDLTKVTLAEAKREIGMGDSAIYANLGIHPTWLALPYNHKSDSLLALCDSLEYTVRVRQQSFGGGKMPTVEAFRTWLDKQVKRGGEITTMTHGISVGYDAFRADTLTAQSPIDVFRECLILVREYEKAGKLVVK